jgi:hypothetical protein
MATDVYTGLAGILPGYMYEGESVNRSQMEVKQL